MLEVVKVIIEVTDSIGVVVRDICVCEKIFMEIAKIVSQFIHSSKKVTKEKTQKDLSSETPRGRLFDKETGRELWENQ